MKNSSIQLARWEQANGSSAGFWLVRQLPGLFVCRLPNRSWALGIRRSNYMQQLQSSGPKPYAWGESFNSTTAEKLLESHPELRQTFSTRRDLVRGLHIALTDEPKNTPGLSQAVLEEM